MHIYSMVEEEHGKTTAAKILARAVNCLNPKDGEPCNECEICKAALDGSLTDIVEMDAASNNSVEDIRSIRDEVNFLPTLAKYRVYIIDEVHMLSTGAFNALLKTLEEPPAHVKFILATTEPQKLPATILSRCQRFDFKKISDENIIKRLKIVCEESKIDITDEALSTIAVLAEGGMRDALSILERCIQEETKITGEVVKELVGIPQLASVNKLVQNIVNKDTQGALDTVTEVLNDGKDIENFLWELTKYVKDILVYKAKGKLDIYSNDEIDQIKELCEKTTKEYLLAVIYQLSDLANQIKWSSQKNIMFQVAIIKLCSGSINKQAGAANEDIEELKNKLEYLEKQVKYLESNGVKINSSGKNVENSLENLNNIAKKIENKKSENKAKVTTIVGEKINTWPKVVDNIKQSGKMTVYTNLMNSTAIQMNDMTVGISFPKGLTPFGKTILEQPENINEIVKQVSIELGQPMRVKILEGEVEVKKPESNEFENLAKGLDIPINILDD